jgi:hypothetical protein
MKLKRDVYKGLPISASLGDGIGELLLASVLDSALSIG